MAHDIKPEAINLQHKQVIADLAYMSRSEVHQLIDGAETAK